MSIEVTPEAEFAAATLFAEVRRQAIGFACPECGVDDATRIKTRPRVFVCRVCFTQRSVTAGTALHRSRVTLVEWAIAVRHAEAGGSSAALSRGLGRRYETVWRMMNRIRLSFQAPRPPAEVPADAARVCQPEDPWYAIPDLERARAWFLVVPARGRYVCVPTDHARWARHNGPNGAELVRGLRRHIREVHRSVSPRWFPAYFRQFEAMRHRSALNDLLAGRARTWRALALPPAVLTPRISEDSDPARRGR